MISLNESIIIKSLQLMDFPGKFIVFVVSCISSASMSIRFNGFNSEYFKPSWGFCQEDTLSPLIFDQYMYQYAILFYPQECDIGSWKPLCFKNQSTLLSHIVFANDIVIFGEATPDNLHTMLTVVERFCTASG